MQQPLVIINSMLYEHEAIRQYVRMLRDSVNEQEAAVLQTKTAGGQAQDSLIRQKDINLREAMQSLYEGIVNHWEKENGLLPPLIGEFVQDGLNNEHHAIRTELEKSRAILTEKRETGLTRDELMAHSYDIRQSTEHLAQLIEAHTAKEDIVLELAKKAIQARSKSE